jgi:hypothetical protein
MQRGGGVRRPKEDVEDADQGPTYRPAVSTDLDADPAAKEEPGALMERLLAKVRP